MAQSQPPENPLHLRLRPREDKQPSGVAQQSASPEQFDIIVQLAMWWQTLRSGPRHCPAQAAASARLTY